MQDPVPAQAVGHTPSYGSEFTPEKPRKGRSSGPRGRSARRRHTSLHYPSLQAKSGSRRGGARRPHQRQSPSNPSTSSLVSTHPAPPGPHRGPRFPVADCNPCTRDSGPIPITKPAPSKDSMCPSPPEPGGGSSRRPTAYPSYVVRADAWGWPLGSARNGPSSTRKH